MTTPTPDRTPAGDLTERCGASARIQVGSMPYIGPCALRHDHDGPVHQDENGAQWTDPRPAAAADSAALCPPTLRDHCAHCGQQLAGAATVHGQRVCHPSGTDRPDCYRLVTVYGEPLGARRPLRASCCEDGDRTYAEMERHLTERAEQAEASAAAAVHLLEHWADEHVILRGVDGTEVHADWCYRCRIEAADEQRQRAEKAERERDEARAERDDYATRLRLTDAAYGELLGENDEQRRRAVDALAAVQRVRDLADNAEMTADLIDPDGERIQVAAVAVRDLRAALNQPEET